MLHSGLTRNCLFLVVISVMQLMVFVLDQDSAYAGVVSLPRTGYTPSLVGCVCLCVRSAPTPPILAGVRGACVWVRVLAFGPPILARV